MRRARLQSSGSDIEEVVVTGIRESLNRARDIKRESTQFVDAIVADDIGKLPDRNVAESLARVSGVQVDRGIAEGTSVSVRGLRQNVYLFNGRQIIDPTGRGGIGLETLGTSTFGLLALVPSELIARLELTKLASADQISGALGGIVDVQTPMPLDGPSRLGAKVGGTYYDQASENGYEAFALASQKFAGDTLGVLVSASYNKRDLSQEGLDTFSGYSRFTDAGGTVRFGNADARPEAIAEERKNLGLNGVLQWQPTDGVEFIADTFYSELDSDRDRHWLSFTPTAGLTNATLLSQQHPAVGNGERAGADQHGVPRHRRRHLVLGVARQLRRDRPAARQRRGRIHQVELHCAPDVLPPAADRGHHADRELRLHRGRSRFLSDQRHRPVRPGAAALHDPVRQHLHRGEQGHRDPHGLDLRPGCRIPQGGEHRRALRPRRLGTESAARRHPSCWRHSRRLHCRRT